MSKPFYRKEIYVIISFMDETNPANIENKPEKKLKLSGFWDFIKTLLIALVLMLSIRLLIVQPYFVSGSSMEPDFQNGEYILIDEISYRFKDPSRGDVVVFKHPEPECTAYVEGSPYLSKILSGPCKNYIKRIVGLPGETVEITGGEVRIKNSQDPTGFVLSEDYIKDNVQTLGDQTVSLGADEYFVLGDNRLPYASSDSREWGPLNKKYINGRAFIRLYPPTELGFISTAKY